MEGDGDCDNDIDNDKLEFMVVQCGFVKAKLSGDRLHETACKLITR